MIRIVSLGAFLHAQGLDRQVAAPFGYDSVAKPKPAPDMVHAFATPPVRPRQIAVVGDNTHDLEMARAAGAVAVAVLSGNGGRADLAPLADASSTASATSADWLDAYRPLRESAACSMTPSRTGTA
jgi:phosphoglycolate phosphatase